MVLVAVFLPALMLIALLALARYEEFMLGGGEAAEEPPGRHLVAVPDLPVAQATAPDAARPFGDTGAWDRRAA
ncbi:hypothetical protein ACGFW5_23715 [Streptomyces sp. NPDC048416]|uniref:hypothetical protein n=1 Tax=Streptomyces sp. NPDC048416 TaxID=3365546 RepID=UPI00371B1491